MTSRFHFILLYSLLLSACSLPALLNKSSVSIRAYPKNQSILHFRMNPEVTENTETCLKISALSVFFVVSTFRIGSREILCFNPSSIPALLNKSLVSQLTPLRHSLDFSIILHYGSVPFLLQYSVQCSKFQRDITGRNKLDTL